MALNLTPEEIEALNTKYCALKNSVANRTIQLETQPAVIEQATLVDDAENKVYDFYDTNIVKAYEDEREAIDGQYVDTPVTIAELDSLGQLDTSSRLYPQPPATNPIRIPQFDGSPLITIDNDIPGSSPPIPDGEEFRISSQAVRETALVSGFSGTSPTITPSTFIVGAVTTATVQITVETTNSSENPVFIVGDAFVAVQGGSQVGIEITGIVSQIPGSPGAGFCTPTATPDTEAQCTIEGGVWTSVPTNYQAVLNVIILSTSSIGSGGNIDETWAGFTNADRIALVDTTDGYTVLMLALRSDLEIQMDARISKLGEQRTALQLNDDPSLDPNAEINVDTSEAALDLWKTTQLISDAGLLPIATERGVRGPQITARISATVAAGSLFYDLRYTSAINKGDISSGSARIKAFRIAVGGPGGTIEALLTQEEAAIAAIEDTLTLAGEPIPKC